MIVFSAIILKFKRKGEKSGWTYIEIPFDLASELKPANKKSFRVKGTLDSYAIKGIALLPMGEGNFIMPLNAALRKGIKKSAWDILTVKLNEDTSPILINTELMECLSDDPTALTYFENLAKSHQTYFSKWIESAKTDATKTKRIAQTVNAMARKQNFGEMLRSLKTNK